MQVEKITVRGQSYILVDREGQGALPAMSSPKYLVYPSVGKVYDFTGYQQALVGGDLDGDGVDIAGKKAKFLKYVPGDPWAKAYFLFEVW